MAPSGIIRAAYPDDLKHVSSKTLNVAGLLVTVYGLDELSTEAKTLTCLWLLHPRLCDQSYMEPIASSAITTCNVELHTSGHIVSGGLIAVSFDQRNHGSREISKTANNDWIGGNETHAQDMFAGYRRFPSK